MNYPKISARIAICFKHYLTQVSPHFIQLEPTYSQLNEYGTVPYFLQSSQKLTSDCLLISVFLPVFAWCDHKIVFFWSAEQFYEHIMQELEKTGKYTDINKQSDVKFWLNWINLRVYVLDIIHSLKLFVQPLFLAENLI